MLPSRRPRGCARSRPGPGLRKRWRPILPARLSARLKKPTRFENPKLARSLLIRNYQKLAHADGASGSAEGCALTPVSMEILMLTAMILICSLTNTPNIADCSRTNALDVLWVPELFSNPVTCFMHGQAYAAGSSVGRDLTENERVKVVCLRKQAAAGEETAVAKSIGPALR